MMIHKTERIIKSQAFLFCAAIWSHLGHSWLSLNYNIKQNIKYLEIKQLLQRRLAFLKGLFSVFVSFDFVAICSSVSLLGNR